MRKQPNPMALRQSATTRRMNSLFKAMSTDYLLREQFITDPSGVVAEYVQGTTLPEETATVSNHLLYSIMSNPDLLRWLRTYASQHAGEFPDRDTFATDFGRAIIENNAHHVVLSLLGSSAEHRGIVSLNESLLPIIVGLFNGGGFASGTEMSTGTYATEQSGTHMSTGGAVAGGTEMSTGTYATEQSGTHMSTGGLIAGGTEMSTGTYATEQSGTHMSTGGLVAGGTEMSTGTYATEQSGTHMSTGGAIDINRLGPGYAQVTLDALASYAAQLRDAGALDEIFGE
jgi:hypothetical protein